MIICHFLDFILRAGEQKNLTVFPVHSRRIISGCKVETAGTACSHQMALRTRASSDIDICGVSGWQKLPSRKKRTPYSLTAPTNIPQLKRSDARDLRRAQILWHQVKSSVKTSQNVKPHSEGTRFQQHRRGGLSLSNHSEGDTSWTATSKALLTQISPKDPRIHRRPIERCIRVLKTHITSSKDSLSRHQSSASSDTPEDSSAFSDSSVAHRKTITYCSFAIYSQSDHEMRLLLPVKTTPKRFPKSLLEQLSNYLIVACLAKICWRLWLVTYKTKVGN